MERKPTAFSGWHFLPDTAQTSPSWHRGWVYQHARRIAPLRYLVDGDQKQNTFALVFWIESAFFPLHGNILTTLYR